MRSRGLHEGVARQALYTPCFKGYSPPKILIQRAYAGKRSVAFWLLFSQNQMAYLFAKVSSLFTFVPDTQPGQQRSSLDTDLLLIGHLFSFFLCCNFVSHAHCLDYTILSLSFCVSLSILPSFWSAFLGFIVSGVGFFLMSFVEVHHG